MAAGDEKLTVDQERGMIADWPHVDGVHLVDDPKGASHLIAWPKVFDQPLGPVGHGDRRAGRKARTVAAVAVLAILTIAVAVGITVVAVVAEPAGAAVTVLNGSVFDDFQRGRRCHGVGAINGRYEFREIRVRRRTGEVISGVVWRTLGHDGAARPRPGRTADAGVIVPITACGHPIGITVAIAVLKQGGAIFLAIIEEAFALKSINRKARWTYAMHAILRSKARFAPMLGLPMHAHG